jgi:glycine/D-amino acid oxidase-like deaminating enzyme
VVGGGYTGLWTALEVVDRAPDAKVVVLEAQGCGFGASGRNGGWATSWYDELHELVARFGEQQGLFLAEQSTLALDRIERVAAEEGIDCHLRRAGALWAAAAPAQVDAFAPVLDAVRAHGRERFFEPVGGAELRRRTGSPILLQALLHTDAAGLQPALLARGLRRLALRRGIRIFEGTPDGRAGAHEPTRRRHARGPRRGRLGRAGHRRLGRASP